MACPADPVLASGILSLNRSQKQNAVQSQDDKLSFNFQPVDAILEGGLESGCIHSVTSQPERGAQELVQALIATHLYHKPDAAATIIDSTLSFDVRRLHDALRTSSKPVADHLMEPIEALSRLKIMQVFDFIGMTESVSELREALDHGYTPVPSAPNKPPHGTVADSQADEEDEMLTLAPLPPTTSPETSTNAPQPSVRHAAQSLLIIDNISQLTLPLLKNNYPQGQSLLTAFFRSLAHITRSHNLCTIVIGAASGRSRTRSDADASLSQFTSCTLRPVIGDSLGYLVDTQIYLHPVHSAHEDAPRLPRATQAGFSGTAQARGVVSVFEIVQDRFGKRAGRWAAFGWDTAGKLQRHG